MLFEAHGRQNKSSNDGSYVGSEARFSERAASQYTESPAAPISAIAFFAVFSPSSAASESPSRSYYPRLMANNNSSGFRWFFPCRGPRERRTDKRLGVIRRNTAA